MGIPLQSKPGNQLSSREDLGCTELYLSCCAETGVPLDLRQGSQGNHWSCLKEVKPLVMYDVEYGMDLDPIQRNQSSSRVNLEYTELFRILAVTSVSFYTCDSVLGDSLEFHQANQGTLRVCLVTQHCSAHNAGESGLILW